MGAAGIAPSARPGKALIGNDFRARAAHSVRLRNWSRVPPPVHESRATSGFTQVLA